MALGGKRPGAGRKPGSKSKKTIEQERALEFLREAIREHLPELIQNKLELALGIWSEQLVTIEDKKRKVKRFMARVYQKEPDGKAIEDLLDRVVGKPKQLIDLGGEIPTKVVINIADDEVEKAKQRVKAKLNKETPLK